METQIMLRVVVVFIAGFLTGMYLPNKKTRIAGVIWIVVALGTGATLFRDVQSLLEYC